MTARISKSTLYGALAASLTACALSPSRVPLGGNYAIAEAEPEEHGERPASEAPNPPTDVAPIPDVVAPEAPKLAPAPAVSEPAAHTNTLHYVPLKRGDSVKADVTISLKATLSGVHAALPGNGELGLDATFRADIKITQASAQTLDELELTLTPTALTTRFGGKSSEMPAGSPKTFEVTLGNSPSVRERGGGKPDTEERAVLMLLVAPLAEFHERWARSPTLELKSGYSGQAPVTVPAILGRSSDSMHIGPFTARYTGRESTGEGAPFQIALPIEYRTDLGKLGFDLTGSARLSSEQARPIAIDLTGPVEGSGGQQREIEVHGSAKLSARLTYP